MNSTTSSSLARASILARTRVYTTTTTWRAHTTTTTTRAVDRRVDECGVVDE